MPFQSRAQQRFAFATGQPFAQRWDRLTDFAGLPEHKDAGADAGAPLSGPGGLLSTPGLGTTRTRKGKKWGRRTKAVCTCGIATKATTGQPGESLGQGITRIRGNLCNVHGRYGPCDAGAAAPTPKGRAKHPRKGAAIKKPKGAAAKKPHVVHQTPDQKRQALATQHAANQAKVLGALGIDATGQAALEALRSGQQPDPKAVEAGGFEKAGLVEQASDGSYRMTAAGRSALSAAQSGDAGRASATISSARDRVAARQGAQSARATRQQAVATRRAAQQAQRAAAAAAKKPAKAGGGGGKKTPAKATPAKVPTKAPPRAKRGSIPHAPSLSAKPAKAAAAAKPAIDPALSAAAEQLSKGAAMAPSDVQALVRNGLAKLDKTGQPVLTSAGLRATKKAARGPMDTPAEQSFVVFKDALGHDRWIARTTTAYRDRDNEIISESALDSDSQRMTATKQFGPLRWWHVGDPDPLATDAPWGPGLDIGDCDYSTVIGRTRVESGTFRDGAIARKVARAADGLEMSPGFFHPLDQPDAAGVFGNIRTFERSVVPVRYGRASNLFTGFTVKEFRMDIAEMEKRFKAMYTELGLTPEQGQAFGEQLVATEKAATAQGIAYKDAETDFPDLEINGVTYKAFPPKAAAAPGVPVVETKAPPMMDAEDDPAQGGDSGADEATEGEPPLDGQPEGDYIGDMSVDDFKTMLAQLLAPVLKMQDMVKSIGDAHAELKGMYGGVATKDDARAAELATLKASLADVTTKIAQIESDQPNTVLPDEVAQALKSEGPAQAQEPAKPQIESTPDRPWRGWAAHTFPELYQNGDPA